MRAKKTSVTDKLRLDCQPLRLPRVEPAERKEETGERDLSCPAFYAELDKRFAELVSLTDGCTPEQCVALALYLGSQRWSAFDIDMSDIDGEARPSDVEFRRAMLLDAVLYDQNGQRAHSKDKEAAAAFVKVARHFGENPPAEESMRPKVNEHRRRTKPRGYELSIIYDQDEARLPYGLIVDMRRRRLHAELTASARRLHAAARNQKMATLLDLVEKALKALPPTASRSDITAALVNIGSVYPIEDGERRRGARKGYAYAARCSTQENPDCLLAFRLSEIEFVLDPTSVSACRASIDSLREQIGV